MNPNRYKIGAHFGNKWFRHYSIFFNSSFRNRIGTSAIAIMLLMMSCGKQKSDVVEATGIIESTEVRVSALVSGQVRSVLAEEGKIVSHGDTLLFIDDTDYRFQAAQAKAGFDLASAQYRLLRRGARAEDFEIAKESLQNASVTLQNATSDFQRLEPLYRTGGVSEKIYTDAKARVESASTQFSSAKANFEKVRNGARLEELEAAKARLEQAEAMWQAAEKKVSDCIVRAPLSGVITAKSIEQGEVALQSATLFRIAETKKIKLKIFVPEPDLPRIHLGDSATLKTDADDGKTYTARVSYISPKAEFTPKNVQTKEDRVRQVFEIWLEAENLSGDLKAGLTAEATLHIK
ncbi:MAG: efflux RND transporter periplasmic adaptor subunit [Chloroherpetonaceae bacterium]|nr:efflux RND transporter periplasmic adaptor subunit [Chloroherpetonaceae bacterium]